MADQVIMGDPATGSLPAPVITRLATEMADPTSDVGASLSGEFVAGLTGQFMSVLRRGIANATLVILGDSTGNETTEWVYRLGEWLALEFSAYTVNYRLWNDGTQAYASAVSLQTGTGSKTLTIYNCSVSGAGFDYPIGGAAPLTRFKAIIPTEPTAVIASFGYNSTGPTYRAQTFTLGKWVLGNFPGIEYIVTAQPPKATGNADAADDLLRSADVRLIAAQEGWGLIDATQPFLNYGAYNALIHVDEIHPNATGMALWLDAVKSYFNPTSPRQQPRTAPASIDRIFMDATRFIVYGSGPTLDSAGGGIVLPKWNFDGGTAEFISGMVDIPPSWRKVDVSLLWSTPGGSTNSVVWQVDYFCATASMIPASGKPAAATTSGTPVTAASLTSVGVFRTTKMWGNERFSGGRPVAFRVRRDAANVADTFVADAWVYGLMIERIE